MPSTWQLPGAPLRVGVVGTGFIGRVHARSIRAAGAVLCGVAASTREHAEAAARELGADHAYADAEQLVRSDHIDVVHIATPNDLHLPLSIAAFEAGKHVVCEKPLATTAGEARHMRDAADAAGLVGAVPFVNRFHPMAREARARLRTGELGTVRTLHGSYLQDWLVGADRTNWRVDAERGGSSRAFADIGSHWVDLAEWLTGELIVELAATISTTVPHRGGADTNPSPVQAHDAEVATEDVACVVFQTSGGACGAVTISQVAPGRKNRLWVEIDGDRRSVAFDQELAEQLWIGSRGTTEILTRDPLALDASAQPYATLPAGHPQGFQDCFDSFVLDTYRTICEGAPVEGLPTFVDGERSARIVDAVLTAAAKNTWVEV